MENIFEKAEIFGQMFDLVRIVEPLTSTVFDAKTKQVIPGHKCYENWKNDTICINCISMLSYQTGKVVVKVDYNKEKIFLAMATPIAIDDKKYVVESLKDITDSGIIVDADKKTVEQLQEEIDELNRLVVTDDLTGCYNRRFISCHLAFDIANSSAQNKNLSVILFDIDFFKRINDKYGHNVGDDVLKQLGTIISSETKHIEGAWAARFGGEEFLVMFQADATAAAEFAEKMRKKIEGFCFGNGEKCISITVSAGIAELKNRMIDVRQLIDVADRNLYDAKQQGRNKIKK